MMMTTTPMNQLRLPTRTLNFQFVVWVLEVAPREIFPRPEQASSHTIVSCQQRMTLDTLTHATTHTLVANQWVNIYWNHPIPLQLQDPTSQTESFWASIIHCDWHCSLHKMWIFGNATTIHWHRNTQKNSHQDLPTVWLFEVPIHSLQSTFWSTKVRKPLIAHWQFQKFAQQQMQSSNHLWATFFTKFNSSNSPELVLCFWKDKMIACLLKNWPSGV